MIDESRVAFDSDGKEVYETYGFGIKIVSDFEELCKETYRDNDKYAYGYFYINDKYKRKVVDDKMTGKQEWYDTIFMKESVVSKSELLELFNDYNFYYTHKLPDHKIIKSICTKNEIYIHSK